MNEVILMCFGAGFLSVVIHCAMKAQSLKKDALAASDTNWSIKKDYLDVDSIPIFISFCTVLLWHLIAREAIKFYPKIQDLIIISYSLVGFLGSYFIQQALGKAKGLIRKTVDSKTNMLHEMLNNQNEESMEELEYYFTIPESAIGIGKPEDYVTINVYAQTTSGIYDVLASELIYYNEPTSDIQFILANSSSEFVGHVPRPRKPR
jgi:hypothetical protein